MKRIVIGLLAVVLVAGLALGGWYYRPLVGLLTGQRPRA